LFYVFSKRSATSGDRWWTALVPALLSHNYFGQVINTRASVTCHQSGTGISYVAKKVNAQRTARVK